MVEVTRDEDVARFGAQAIAHPLGRIVRLEIARGRKFRERVACPPEGFRRLARAQLAAVPDHGRLDAASGRRVCKTSNLPQSCG